MKHLTKILLGAIVGCFLMGSVAFATNVAMPTVTVPVMSYYYDASGIVAPTVTGAGRYLMGVLRIDGTGANLLGQMNLTPPWILRCYTNNPIGPAGGRGGFVNAAGTAVMTTKIWCGNYGPLGWADAGLSQLLVPPAITNDEYWKGILVPGSTTDYSTEPVWLRLFDSNDNMYYWAPTTGWGNVTQGQVIDRLICAIDPTYTDWVSPPGKPANWNPEGDATLPVPFGIGIAIEPSATTAAGTYTCNLVLEVTVL